MNAPPAATAPPSPFSPPHVRWRAISPRLAYQRRTLEVLGNAVLALAAAVAAAVSGLAWLWLLVPAALVDVGVSWWVIGRQVRNWNYAEQEDDLIIRRGIMFQKLVVVPYGRLQYVDVEAGPLERLFGIASVQLHTASAGTDARIPGLAPAEAARLRDQLSARGQAHLAGL
jgi:membrane protein YdbS with pleckstrin-like domain